MQGRNRDPLPIPEVSAWTARRAPTPVGPGRTPIHPPTGTTRRCTARAVEFAVQARLIERHGDVVVRDEARLDSATALGAALRTARPHAADGFTVWIFEVHRDAGVRPIYVAVDTLYPDRPQRRQRTPGAPSPPCKSTEDRS